MSILHRMLCLKQLDFLKNCKNSNFITLPHCLTTFAGIDTKRSIVQLPFYSTATNLPVSCFFYLPLSSFLHLHAVKLYLCTNFFQSTLSLSSVYRCHNIILSTCATVEALDKHGYNMVSLRYYIANISLLKLAWQHR